MLSFTTTIVVANIFLPSSQAIGEDVQFSHTAFYTLIKDSKASRKVFITACQQYLSGHEGITLFSTGIAAETRHDEKAIFHVEVRIVFRQKEDYERFKKHPRRLEFVKEYSELWSRQHVFNTRIQSIDTESKSGNDLLIRDRILRIAGDKENRENAIKELVVTGKTAVPLLLAALKRHSSQSSFGSPRDVRSYNGVVRVLVALLGPANILSTVLRSPQLLSSQTLEEFKRNHSALPKEEQRKILSLLKSALTGKNLYKRIVALQIELVVGDSNVALKELTKEIEKGELANEAASAALEADSSWSKYNSQLIDLYRAVLRHKALMAAGLQHLKDHYDFGFDREKQEIRFSSIFPQIFVAYLHERDSFVWAGEMFFLEDMLLRGLRTRWNEYDPQKILLDSNYTIDAKKQLVLLFAQSMGRYEVEDFWNGQTLAKLNPLRINFLMHLVFLKSNDKALKDIVRKYFPEVGYREF